MATSKKGDLPMPEDDIIIERREIVGKVTYDPTGYGANMLESAFLIATGYVAEETRNDTGVTVEFRYGLHTFSVASEPIAEHLSSETQHRLAGQDY